MGGRKPSLKELAKTCEAAGFGDVAWSDVLQKIALAVDGRRGILLGEHDVGRYTYSCIFNHDPTVAAAYNRHYNRLDPRAAPSLEVGVGETRLGQDLMPNAAISHTEYFDAISRAGNISDSVFGVISDDAELGRRTISLQRSFEQEFFGEEEAALLRALLPRLETALRNSLRVARVMAEERGDGLVLYALLDTELNLRLLPGSDAHGDFALGPVEIAGDRLGCNNERLRAAILSAVERGMRGESASIDIDTAALRFDPVPEALQWLCDGRGEVFLTIARTQLAQDANLVVFAEGNNLTPRERSVLEALVMHHAIPDAAEALGISTETARWHAKNICTKSGHRGVSRLVEAARRGDLSNLA